MAVDKEAVDMRGRCFVFEGGLLLVTLSGGRGSGGHQVFIQGPSLRGPL